MITLSELPEDIVDYIFSKLEYLTSKDVIQLSLVSKQFHSLVQRHSALVFDDSGPHSDMQLNHMISTLDRYQKHDIPLEKFTFRLNSEPPRSRRTHNRCIRLAAAQKGLRFLSLSMPEGKGYNVPRPVFKVESLVELTLKNCHVQLPEKISWRNLRQLTLNSVDIGEGVFMNIMRNCPLIETLDIDYMCTGDIQYDYLSASTNLGKPMCQNIKDLTMMACDPIIKSTTNDLILNFPRLENLNFFNDYHETISISSPSLKRIEYNYYDNRDIGPQQTHFNAPNMVLFKFQWFWTKAIDFPELSFTGNPSGWNSNIRFVIYKEVCSLWVVQLKEMLKKFSAALNNSEIASVVLELRDTIVPKARGIRSRGMKIFPREIIPMFGIKSRGVRFCLSSARAILDGIFSLCLPKRVVFWHSNSISDAEDPPCIRHHVIFATSGCERIIEVLKNHEEEDLFLVVFNLE